MLQVRATCNRIYLEKKRNFPVTCCEFFSHFIILNLLVIGYSMSIIEPFPEKINSHVDIQIPPLFVNDDGSVNSATMVSEVQRYLAGPLPVPSLGTFNAISRSVASVIDDDIIQLLDLTAIGQSFANVYTVGALHFSPAGPLVDDLIEYMTNTTQALDEIVVHVHEDEATAVNYILDHLEERTLALIVLHHVSREKVNYEIRMNYTTLPSTSEIVNLFNFGFDTEYQTYYISGFLSIQAEVDKWVFHTVGKSLAANGTDAYATCQKPYSIGVPFPTFSYDSNPFYPSVGFLLGLTYTMSLMFPVSRLVKSIVEEKETRMREIMKIMGLKDSAYQFSWFLVAFITFFWAAFTITLISSSSFLPNSNGTLLFMFFFLFCMSLIGMSFMMSTLFSNSKYASIVAPVILFVSLLPRYIFQDSKPNQHVVPKFGVSLLSTTAFGFGADYIAAAEYSGVGIQLSNMFDGGFSFANCMQMMFFDCVLYLVLAWYLDLVVPQEYGTPLSPLFLFQYDYWITCCVTRPVVDNFPYKDHLPELIEESVGDPEAGVAEDSHSGIEKLTTAQKATVTVQLCHLNKSYANGKRALRDVGIAFVEGQITCLLGHNGAGKSTTVAILTGMLTRSSGSCSIYGLDMDTNMAQIRQLTGICPQQNVLFPTLTVTEHLMLFGQLKGLYGQNLVSNVGSIISEVGLTEKVDAVSSSLSGGMKRKLCLAMALVGNPSFVLLDEPTSGMDPYSRRSTWDMLDRCKKNRVVILTTHFMDEADMLGDRIAIMSHGQLLCSGSPMYLKNKFGDGYILSMSRRVPSSILSTVTSEELQPVDEELSDERQVTEIEVLIKSVVPEAKAVQVIAGEYNVLLPLSSSEHFARLFERLKEHKRRLGVVSYGVGITTLEQVFLRLTQEAHVPEDVEMADDIFSSSRIFLGALFAEVYRLSCCSSVGVTVLNQLTTAGGLSDTGRHGMNGEVPAFTKVEAHALSVSHQEDGKEGEEKDFDELHLPEKRHIRAADYPDGISNEHGVEMSDFADSSPNARTSDVVEEDVGKDEPHRLKDHHLAFVQFGELLRKRWIVTKRDINGLFFQVIFPAIQILSVLAILTIRLNWAGPTMKLNADQFQENPSAVIAGNLTSIVDNAIVDNMFDNGRMDLTDLSWASNSTSTSSNNSYYIPLESVLTSTDLSMLLLDDSFDATDVYVSDNDRYGAAVFHDSIPINVTVNYLWLRANLEEGIDFLSGNQSIINITDIASLLPNSLASDFLDDFLSEQSITIDLSGLVNTVNVTNVIDALNTTGVEVNLQNYFVEVSFGGVDLNVSITDVYQVLFPNSSTVNVTFTSLIDDLLNVSTTVTTGNVSVETTNINTTSITVDVSLQNQNVELFFGNTTLLNISFIQIFDLIFPNASVEYELHFPVSHTIVHNTTSPHGIAIFQAELIAAAFDACFINSSSSSVKSSYYVKNHPLPITDIEALEIKIVMSVLVCMFILVPLCYIPASFVTFLVKERSTKSKHLQMVSGVSPHMYWVATYVWDICLFTVLVFFIMLAFYMYGQDESIFLSSETSALALFLMLMSYGTSVLPLCYLYSLGFTNHSTAQISIMVINTLTGFVLILTYFIMVNIPSTRDAGLVAVHIFRFFPPFNVGEGLINLVAQYYLKFLFGSDVNVLNWEVCGRSIVFMCCESLGYFVVVLLAENLWLVNLLRAFQKQREQSTIQQLVKPNQEIDEDVNDEFLKAKTANPRENCLLIQDLKKVYRPTLPGGVSKFAVRGLSLACPMGERFGLLGINGAGKSSTIDILTGDVQASDGSVYIGGLSLNDLKTRQMIGYCPQTDPLFDLMTAKETLWFFGRIRGIPEKTLMLKVERLLSKVGLLNYADRPSGTYSGGNKRKLSLAIALVGDPKLLLLDEPSSGMDPLSRRHMWDVIATVSGDRSVILTTHSMEECEALCSRIGIMVSGRLQCLGPSQHLKSRFGSGYQIEMRCVRSVRATQVNTDSVESSVTGVMAATDIADANGLVEGDADAVGVSTVGMEAEDNVHICWLACAECLPFIEIDEQYDLYLRLRCVSDEMNLADAFACLEKLKVSGMIENYCVSQATLEQVFIKFAKLQEEEK